MTSSYNFSLTDGTSLGSVRALETNGIANLATPRQIITVDLTGGAGNNFFVLADDLTYRFTPGFTFDVIYSFANDNTYTVVSSSFSGGQTTIVVAEAIPTTMIPLGYIVYTVPAPEGLLTSLTLVGRGTPNWGELIQTNLVHILENSASMLPPPAPLSGQLWFDKETITLSVFAGPVYTITNVDTGTGTWTISGDHVAELTPGETIYVFGNNGNGGNTEQYTIDSITLNGSNTDIVVAGSLPLTSTEDGFLYSASNWHALMRSDRPEVFGDLDMHNFKIINLALPTLPTDGANKQYVDSVAYGITWRDPMLDPNLMDDTQSSPPFGFVADYETYFVKPAMYTVNSVVPGPGGTWVLTGNHATLFNIGDLFVVDGDTGGGNGTYTVVTATDVGPNTEIVVNESIAFTANGDGSVYHSSGDWNGLDGHLVAYDSGTMSWIDVSGRALLVGDRIGVLVEPDGFPPTNPAAGGLTGEEGKIAIVDTISVPDYTITYTFFTPVDKDALFVDNSQSLFFGKAYTFVGTWGVGTYGTDYRWIKFSAATSLEPGDGLITVGNVINVGAGTGIIVNPDDVEVDPIYIQNLFATQISNTVINDLLDVDTTGLTIGDALVWDGMNWVPGQNTTLALDDISDVTITNPIVNDVLTFDGADWINLPISALITGNVTAVQAYDISTFARGLPVAFELILNYVAVRHITIPTDWFGSRASAAIGATAQTDFDIQLNGVSIGTLRFPAGGSSPQSGLFLTPFTSVTLVPGDVLTFVSPGTPDTTLEDISVTIKTTIDDVLTTYDIASAAVGVPDPDATVMSFVAVRDFVVPTNLVGSAAKSQSAATASTDFSIKKNGVSFGTINFAAAATTATFTSVSMGFTAGDILTIVSPNPSDLTLADIAFTVNTILI